MIESHNLFTHFYEQTVKVVPDTDKGYGNMKNIYAVICLILGLMFFGSCQTSDVVTNMTEEMELSRTMTSDIQSVVELVRQGNADAYKELALGDMDNTLVEDFVQKVGKNCKNSL